MIQLDDELLLRIRNLSLSQLILKHYPSIQLQFNNTVYMGLCPFHKEAEPSFTVFNREGQENFYCYGCHAGNYKETQISNDIIAFYMAIEHVDFKTACEQLCNIFGVQYNSVHKDPEVNRLRTFAYQNNQQYFATLSTNPYVLNYLYERGLTRESIQYWQLGLVPANDYMITHRNRLAIPIMDTNNKTNNICGFAYRSLEGEIQTPDRQEHYATNDGVRYRNDSNSRIFDKSKVLFGLPMAAESIRTGRAAIVVEGYFDVMLMHQSCITNVVGIMGTSFTSEQMSMLRKYTNRIFMLMDADEAGTNSMYLTIPVLYERGFEVFVCVPPPGMDAADMCNHFCCDRQEIAKYLNNHTIPGHQFMLQKGLSIYQSKVYLARTELLQQALPLLTRLQGTDRALYGQYLSDCTGINPYLLTQTTLTLTDKQDGA